jgi:protein tyrosine/serine phosphatase
VFWLHAQSLKRWGEVVPGLLYRSGQLRASQVEAVLRERGIALVIDLSEERESDRDQRAEEEATQRLGVELLRLPLSGDGRGDPARYVEALAAATAAMRAKRPVLVHCAAGSQRIGGFVALYRVLLEGRSTEEVRREMEQYGWRRRRDAVLLDYLNAHVGRIAADLVERGVLDRVPESPPRF